MSERLILCGTVSDRALPVEDANPVRLDRSGTQPNVHLTIGDIYRPMVKALPDQFADLIDIAAYVYVADQAVKRGGDTGADLGEEWRRKLHFRIPVRNPERWRSEPLYSRLVSTLSFLSEDEYHFEFEQLETAHDQQRGFEFTETPYDGIAEEVVLFSGGLDSLAGAVQEAVVDKRKIVLVNHRSTEKLSQRHRRLLDSLGKHAGAQRPIHIPVRINKDESLCKEYTQRSRSFLYASLGATVAALMGLARIRFYENGVVSLNLPPSAQVVGARATRTTHPQVLRGFSDLFTCLAERPFEVENLFLWKTKTEVVKSIENAGCQELLSETNSCTRTWLFTNDHPHCGVCSQCIDRRFAILAAGQAGHDPADDYAVDLFVGEREEGLPRAMLAAYLEMANQIESMTSLEFFGRFGEASRVLGHIDGGAEFAAQNVFELHRRHAEQVMSVVDQGLRDFAPVLRKRTLPPSCLFKIGGGHYRRDRNTIEDVVGPAGQECISAKGSGMGRSIRGQRRFYLVAYSWRRLPAHLVNAPGQASERAATGVACRSRPSRDPVRRVREGGRQKGAARVSRQDPRNRR